MHILLVADGRSPTARRWLESLQAAGLDVSLLSTFPCPAPAGLRAFHAQPVAFSQAAGAASGAGGRATLLKRLAGRARPLLLAARYALGPASVRAGQQQFTQTVNAIQPDLVHALRIPYEGMLATATPPGMPLIVSTWGNDLTLHARASHGMGALTRACLRRADGLMSDTYRDIRLATGWGFDPAKPSLAVPGSGGLDLREVSIAASQPLGPPLSELPAGRPWVVNPRGFRPGSVHTDVFFKAAALVASQRPDVLFICPGMAGSPEAQGWVERLGLAENMRLLPALPQAALWQLFKRAVLMVSISSHDGTPNSLLEAMACGCLPVAGDIESLREWVTPGVNGLLVPPRDEQAVAAAILEGLSNDALRRRAAEVNLQVIARRAEVHAVREKVLAFYRHLRPVPAGE